MTKMVGILKVGKIECMQKKPHQKIILIIKLEIAEYGPIKWGRPFFDVVHDKYSLEQEKEKENILSWKKWWCLLKKQVNYINK